jgi:hypothetical protein
MVAQKPDLLKSRLTTRIVFALLICATLISAFTLPRSGGGDALYQQEGCGYSDESKPLYDAYNIFIALDTSLSIENSPEMKRMRNEQARAILETLAVGVLADGMDVRFTVVSFDADVSVIGDEIQAWNTSDFQSFQILEHELASYLSEIVQAKGEKQETNFERLFKYARNDSKLFLRDDGAHSRNIVIVVSDLLPTPNREEQVSAIKAAWISPENNVKDDIELFLFALDSSDQVGDQLYGAVMSWWQDSFISEFEIDPLATIFEIDAKNSSSATHVFSLLPEDVKTIPFGQPVRVPLISREPGLVILKALPNLSVVSMDRARDTLAKIAEGLRLNPYHLLGLNGPLLKFSALTEEAQIHEQLPIGTRIYLPKFGLNPDELDFSLTSQATSNESYFEVWKLDPDEKNITFSPALSRQMVMEQGRYLFSGERTEFDVKLSSLTFDFGATITVTVIPDGFDPKMNERYEIDFTPGDLDNDSVPNGPMTYDAAGNTFSGQFVPSNLTRRDRLEFEVQRYQDGALLDSVPCSLVLVQPAEFAEELKTVYDVVPGQTFDVVVPIRMSAEQDPTSLIVRGGLEEHLHILSSSASLAQPSDIFTATAQTESGWEFTKAYSCGSIEERGQLTVFLNQPSFPTDNEPIQINCLCQNSSFYKILLAAVTIIALVVITKGSVRSSFIVFSIWSEVLAVVLLPYLPWTVVEYILLPLTALSVAGTTATAESETVGSLFRKIDIVDPAKPARRRGQLILLGMGVALFGISLWAITNCKFPAL